MFLDPVQNRVGSMNDSARDPVSFMQGCDGVQMWSDGDQLTYKGQKAEGTIRVSISGQVD